MDVLLRKDLQLFLDLKRAGVFQRLDGNRLDASGGCAILTCGDNHRGRFSDIFMHHARVQGERHELAEPFVFSVPGGAGAIAPHSPVNKDTPKFDVYLIRKMRVLADEGKFGTIALYTHFPCLALELGEVSFCKAIQLMIDGKQRLKRELGILVGCFCHFDLPQRKQTYFLSREHWEGWVENNPCY